MEASPRIIETVEKVVRYINSRPEVEDFFPQTVAKAISDTEAAAMLGLYLLEKKGVRTRHLITLCDKHAILLDSDGTCPHALIIAPKITIQPTVRRISQLIAML
jgi:hypothetical protein